MLKKIDKSYNMAATPANLLSYLPDQKTKDWSLELHVDEKKKQALGNAKKKVPSFKFTILFQITW